MPSHGQLLQWIVISLLGVAVIMVASAGMSIAGEPVTIASLLTGRTAIYAVLAVVAMVLVGGYDLRRLAARRGFANPALWLLLLAVALCALALVPGLGRNVNGASRWLYIGPTSWNFSFQPSELAKWAMVIALAWWGARQADRMRSFTRGLLPALLMLAVVCGLIVKEDLGTATLIGVVGLGVLIAAGARLWHILVLLPAAAAAVVAFIVTSPYRMRRITAFLDPWADPEDTGYHLIQSLIAIAGGGPTGRGLGNGVQKFGYLPEDTTDFIFAVVCEELGLAGAVLIVALYVALLLIGLAIVRECRHAFGRLLGLGILLTIGLQALLNIAVVTGMVPTKGIALPLLSSGGTGWVLTASAIGLLTALDRTTRLENAHAALPHHAPTLSVSASDYAEHDEPEIVTHQYVTSDPATAS